VLKLDYSIVIEATDDPNYFGFSSPDLQGFTGVGHSVEDCLYEAENGIAEHVRTMREQGMPVPPRSPDPTVLIQNEKKRKSA